MPRNAKWLTLAAPSGALVAFALMGPGAWKLLRLRKDAEQQWRDLSHCLVGPIDGTTSPGARYRRIELQLSVEQSAEAPDAWPGRCRRYGEALLQTVRARPAEPTWAALRAALEHAAPSLDAWAAASPRVDDLFDAARVAAIVAPGPVRAPSPPAVAPSRPLPRLAGKLARVVDPVARARVHFELGGPPRRLCRSAVDLLSVRCVDLPPLSDRIWPPPFALPDLVEGAPLGVTERADDERCSLTQLGAGAEPPLTVGESAEIAVDRDGGLAVIRARPGHDREWILSRRSPRGPLSDSFVHRDLQEGTPRPFLVGPWLLYTEGRSVRVRRVLPTSSSVGEAVTLFEAEAPPRWFGACADARGSVVVAARQDEDATVLFERDGHWSAIDAGPAPLVAGRGSPARVAHLDCRTDEANLSWVVRSKVEAAGDHPTFVLHRTRCTPVGCGRWQSAPLRLLGAGPARDSGGGGLSTSHVDEQLAVLGDDLLLVWSSGRFRLRARLAAPDAIATAPDLVLSTDVDGPVELVTREAGALVLFATGTNETAAVRIDTSRAVTPLGVEP